MYLNYIIVFCVPIICGNHFQYSYRSRHQILLLLLILLLSCCVCVCMYFIQCLRLATIFASSDFGHEHFYLHVLWYTFILHLWFWCFSPFGFASDVVHFLPTPKQIYSAHSLNTSTLKQSIMILCCYNLIRRQKLHCPLVLRSYDKFSTNLIAILA